VNLLVVEEAHDVDTAALSLSFISQVSRLPNHIKDNPTVMVIPTAMV
jgi:hypothetical protein